MKRTCSTIRSEAYRLAARRVAGGVNLQKAKKKAAALGEDEEPEEGDRHRGAPIPTIRSRFEFGAQVATRALFAWH